jgi:fused signal recognition particle receptor
MKFKLFGKNKQSDKKKEIQSLSKDLELPRKGLAGTIKSIFSRETITEEEFDELEEILISSDLGMTASMKIMQEIRTRHQRKQFKDIDEIRESIREILTTELPEIEIELDENSLNIFLIMGVNGVGKTTSIAKLARYFSNAGAKVTLAACDTFRAAAVDQLKIWGERVGVEVVAGQDKADPGSVLYKAIDRAIEDQAQLLIVDTAGRIHTKNHLMQEMGKLNRIIGKKSKSIKIHKINMLVLDSTTGQNAISQANSFHEATTLNALILTKLDSTAKGGIVLAISNELKIPVAFVGTGEQVEKFHEFDLDVFIDSVLME